MPNQKRACTDEARCETSKFKSNASAFRRLSKRFEEYRQQDARAAHLSVDLAESKVRSGRLLVEAIDAGAFPKSMSEQNGEWWDRTIGRLPGSVLTISPDGFRWRKGEPPPGENPEFVAAASKPLDPAQLARCWTFAIGSWLVPKFPSRFRHNAAGKDWTHVLVDGETGRPMDKDGKVLRGRWFKDGKPLPYDFQWAPDLRDGNYEWRLEGEPAMEHEKYDEADWLHHLRTRAEVYAEACQLLADLVERSCVTSDKNDAADGAGGRNAPAGAVAPLPAPGARPPQRERWSEILLLKQIAPKVGLSVGARRRGVEPRLKELGSVLKPVHGGYRVRLDTMDPTYRAKFDDSAT